MASVVQTVYGVFKRGVLVASIQEDDEGKWPAVAVYTTRERAEEEIAKLRRPEQYHVASVEVIE